MSNGIESGLDRREDLYEVMNFAAQKLNRVNRWEQEVLLVLERLGQAAGVSQVFLYENKPLNTGKLAMSLRFTWYDPGSPAPANNPELIDIPYEKVLSLALEGKLSRGQFVYGDIDELPQELQICLKPREIYSFVIAPVFSGERWWGFIALVVCQEKRNLGKPVIDALTTVVDILGSAIQHQFVQENLRASEGHLRQVTNNMLDMVSECDNRGVLTYISPSCKVILGYEPAEMLGRFAFELVHPDDLTIFKSIIQRSVTEHLIKKIEYRIRHAAGHYIWLETVSKFMFDEQGKSLGVIFGSRDITDRKQIEAAVLEQRTMAEALRDTASVLTSTLNFDEVLDRILLNIGHVVAHDAADVYLVDGGVAHSVRSHGYANRNVEMAVQNYPFRIADVPNLSWMAETGQSIAIPEVREYPGWVEIPEIQWVRSYAGAPIRIQSETAGFLSLVSAVPGFFTSSLSEQLQVFAEQAAIAIQNARLFEQTQQRAVQLALLNETTEALRDTAAVLTSTLNFDEVLARILTNVGRVVAHDAANISLVEEGYARVVRAVRYEERHLDADILTLRLKIDEVANLQWMMETGRPLAIPDVWLYPHWKVTPLTNWVRSYAGAPIRIKDETVGFLSLDSAKPGFFNYDHAERLQSFANQAGIAIQNARLFEETNQRARQLALLNELTQKALEMPDLHAVVQMIADRIGELMKADGCYLTLWDRERQLPIPVAASGLCRDSFPLLQFENGEPTLTAVVLKTGQSLIVEDALNSPLISPRISGLLHAQSILALPLIASNQNMGVLLISYHNRYDFKPEEVTFCEQAARQVTLAIARAQLLEEERQRSAQLSRTNFFITALSNVATRIETVPDPDGVMEALGLELAQLGIFCLVALIEKESPLLAVRYFSMKSDIPEIGNKWLKMVRDFRLPPEQFPFYDEVITQRRVVFTDNPASLAGALTQKLALSTINPTADLLGLVVGAKAIALPLMVEEQVIGFMGLWGKDLQDTDAQAASIFASQVAVALENSRLYTEVQQLAITDELTGFYNRRGLFELGQREIERALRFKRPLAALMMDIDFFKVVNDTNGHESGDQILRALAARCRDNVREVDVLGRYGGDEFVILLVENDLAVASQVAERLRMSISDLPFATSLGNTRITVSIGVSILDSQTSNLAALINLADQGLYAAKMAGKNQVAITGKQE